MDNPLVVSLVVTGIGMAMLFLALAVLYGLMVLMTGVIRDQGAGIRDQEPGSGEQDAGGRRQEAGGGEQEGRMRRQRAAVVAVALARAGQELGAVGVGAPGAEEPISAWRALHHQRQLTRHSPRR